MEAVLSDVIVIDLSRVLAGPYCTMILGDLGATVIKVEQPGKGDDTRHFGPPYIAGESAYYLGLNRNKQSILLDFSKPEGKERLLKLVSTATVLVENFRPGSLERQGLGYEALRAINPGLIYCSISGYGQTGPYALRPGYDFVAQAPPSGGSRTAPRRGCATRPPTLRWRSPARRFASGRCFRRYVRLYVHPGSIARARPHGERAAYRHFTA